MLPELEDEWLELDDEGRPLEAELVLETEDALRDETEELLEGLTDPLRTLEEDPDGAGLGLLEEELLLGSASLVILPSSGLRILSNKRSENPSRKAIAKVRFP
jgi:hypothetical protein